LGGDGLDAGFILQRGGHFPGLGPEHGHSKVGENGHFGPDALDDLPGIGNVQVMSWLGPIFTEFHRSKLSWCTAQGAK
jgi:hypothetical protein